MPCEIYVKALSFLAPQEVGKVNTASASSKREPLSVLLETTTLDALWRPLRRSVFGAWDPDPQPAVGNRSEMATFRRCRAAEASLFQRLAARDKSSWGERLRGHEAGVACVARRRSTQGCDVVFSGAMDATVRCWRRSAGASKFSGHDAASALVLRGHTDSVWAVRPLPWGEGLLASGSFDGTLKIWDIGGGGSACVQTLAAHSDRIMCACVGEAAAAVDGDCSDGGGAGGSGAAGHVVVSGSRDASVCIWDPRAGQGCAALAACLPLRALRCTPTGRFSQETTVPLALQGIDDNCHDRLFSKTNNGNPM